SFATIIFLIIVLIGMLLNKETVVSVVIGFLFLGFMTAFYFIRGYDKLPYKDQHLE
ncbi:MAG: gamma-aminobutyrate permease, partial [Staphylococcus simulans]|nr:gamma-aminobutyrate permease [Staphylococcus simulans]